MEDEGEDEDEEADEEADEEGLDPCALEAAQSQSPRNSQMNSIGGCLRWHDLLNSCSHCRSLLLWTGLEGLPARLYVLVFHDSCMI